MVQPKRTDTNSVIPESTSYIKAGFEDILDHQIVKILDTRFNLIQSSRINSIQSLPTEKKKDLLLTARKSHGQDWKTLRKYRKTFLDDRLCNTLSEAKSAQRPEPMNRPQYIAILRKFLSMNKFPNCEDVALFRKDTEVILQSFPKLQTPSIVEYLKKSTKKSSDTVLNDILRIYASSAQSDSDSLFTKFIDAVQNESTAAPQQKRETLSPLSVFANFYFEHRNDDVFQKLFQSTLNVSSIQSTAEEQLSYYNFCKHYRMPPLNLSRLMTISVFSDQELDEIKKELKSCINEMLNSLHLDRLIHAMQEKYSGALQLTYGHLYEALRYTADRIAFHGEGDVLQFLTAWLHSQANDEKQVQLNEEKIANYNQYSIINLDAKTLGTEQDIDERVGIESPDTDLFERADVAKFLTTLVLETYEELRTKCKETREAYEELCREISDPKKRPKTVPPMQIFKYNERVEKLTIDRKRVAAEILKENDLYELLPADEMTNNDKSILDKLSQKADEMQEAFRERRYALVLDVYTEFLETVNALNVNLSAKHTREFTNMMKRRTETSL